jgi:tripartite-type tricarboxylate transporter receptor subunit TctC
MRAVVTVLAAFAACGNAGAQSYPERQVVVVVPFPAGGATDPVARALTQRMSEIWKQPVVVLNRAGAGGNIGSESVARAAPDGHTLLFGTTSPAIGPSLYAKLPFDVLKDFATISQASVAPNILVVHPSVPARSVKELIAIARAKPGQLISASAGTGTSNHLSLVQFVSLAKVDIAHVPYKGAAPAVVDTVDRRTALSDLYRAEYRHLERRRASRCDG